MSQQGQEAESSHSLLFLVHLRFCTAEYNSLGRVILTFTLEGGRRPHTAGCACRSLTILFNTSTLVTWIHSPWFQSLTVSKKCQCVLEGMRRQRMSVSFTTALVLQLVCLVTANNLLLCLTYKLNLNRVINVQKKHNTDSCIFKLDIPWVI